MRRTETGERVVSNVQQPTLIPYLADSANTTGAAVIVIPGGGHREIWLDHEGHRVGKWLSTRGVSAFVLKYRLAGEAGSPYTVEGDEIADVQRAIRYVRSQAQTWGILARHVGVLGFSAGGELALLAGIRAGPAVAEAGDPVERQSAVPDFMGLMYPGLPSHLDLHAGVPPAFLLCGEEDSPAISEALPQLYLALRRAGGSAELHVLARTGHGFGLRESNPAHVAMWTTLFYAWMDASGFLTRQ
jgi:endo-1,4-beta-xylanase